MNGVHKFWRIFPCFVLATSLAWAYGCKPLPSRIGLSDSNSTGSNATDGMLPVEKGVDDLSGYGSAFATPSGSDIAAASESSDVSGKEGSEKAGNATYKVDPLDWHYCRGPHYNNVSYETGLIDDFDPAGGEGSNVTWFREDLGTRSTPIVMRGKLYTLTRSNPGSASEGEQVTCLDAKTGESLWENKFNVWLSDVPDTRVGWSSVVGDPETGRVYALGVCGYFQCLDGDTGETIWSRSMHEEFGFLSTYGGRTNFPIVVDDQVIISAIVIGWGKTTKPAHRFVSFDKATGDVIWFEGTTPLPYDTTYSPPALKTIKGQKQLIFGSGDGMVWALQPRTGKGIWKYGLSRRGLNVGPFVIGDRIYTGQSEEVRDPRSNKMGTLVGFKAGSGDLTGSKENTLWSIDQLMVGKSAPLVIEDRVYAFEDGGNLHILDATTGKEIPVTYKDRKAEKLTKMSNIPSNPLYADGKIYAVSKSGQWLIARPDREKGLDFVAYSGRDKIVEETYASPIASHGRVYITTMGGIYCLKDKNKEAGLAKHPEACPENDVADDTEIAHVQVVPAEVLLRPGEEVSFKTRLYNANGQFLRTEDHASWNIDGGGTITPSGTFTAAKGTGHSATELTATVGNHAGTARLRVIPDLPWTFDFEDVQLASAGEGKPASGQPPITWVGMRYRHQVRDKDGSKTMVKVTTIPKGTRSQGWIGHPDLHDYTIQADVMGAERDDKMPEIGITAQGYTLALQGNNQLIQIRTWVTQERLALHKANRNEDGSSQCKFPFEWKSNQWYTMKLKVSNAGDIAKLQGKVWVKGKEEPEAWTIECEDPAPQRVGAPGFYGDANFAEIYIDNIHVTPNDREN